jgi:predicted ArsR family transcriptional regulator
VTVAALGKRFFDTTRGRLTSLLRRGSRTVDELAEALELTSNAVRNHLSSLERDGLVRQVGVRRGTGAGKPAVLFELHPDAEPLFSLAYPPVLTAMVETLVEELPPERTEELMHAMGRRLARGVGTPSGTFEDRVRAGAAVLTALGGEVDVVDDGSGGALTIRGAGCPLSAVVSHRPEMCHAVETLLAETTGLSVRSCCTHGERSCCCFSIARP